jgi:hypothetical protein
MGEDILKEILPLVGTIVVALIGWGLTELTRWIRAKTGNERLGSAMEQLSLAVMISVKEIEQNARPLLSDGKLTDEEKQKLKNMAIEKIKSRLTPTMTKELSKNLVDLNEWIGAQVDGEVLDMNRAVRFYPTEE